MDRKECADLLAAEVVATRAEYARLAGDDWSRPTSSEGWTVRDMVAHTVAQFEELAKVSVMLGRLRAGKRRYPDLLVLDSHNKVQIEDAAGWTEDELRARFDRFGRSGVRAVRRMPFFIRAVPAGWFFPGSVSSGTRLSYVFDVLATRDTWMHRVEIARATGREIAPTAHDAAVVRAVVADLAAAWTGPAVALELTGPAGGGWTLGAGTPEHEVRADAIQAMLHLSGRPADGIDPAGPIGAARVVF